MKINQKFNEGDWITIENSADLTPGCMGVRPGTYEVVKRSESHSGMTGDEPDVIFINGDGIWCISGKFRLATLDEIESAASVIRVNGYIAEFFPEYVKFGCAHIAKKQILLAHSLMQDNSKYSNKQVVYIVIGAGTFDRKTVKLLAEHYLNKNVKKS